MRRDRSRAGGHAGGKHVLVPGTWVAGQAVHALVDRYEQARSSPVVDLARSHAQVGDLLAFTTPCCCPASRATATSTAFMPTSQPEGWDIWFFLG